jgi:hypothetical protein
VDIEVEIQTRNKLHLIVRVELSSDRPITTVNNKFTRIVDFWLDNIVSRFITEFVVDTVKLYNVAEQEFLRGP